MSLQSPRPSAPSSFNQVRGLASSVQLFCGEYQQNVESVIHMTEGTARQAQAHTGCNHVAVSLNMPRYP